jgi:hypothetical protein
VTNIGDRLVAGRRYFGHSGFMGIWVEIGIFVVLLGAGLVWFRRGGEAGRTDRREWRRLRRNGRRGLRQLRRESGLEVNGSEIASRRHTMQGMYGAGADSTPDGS